jgi:hypothetical protein
MKAPGTIGRQENSKAHTQTCIAVQRSVDHCKKEVQHAVQVPPPSSTSARNSPTCWILCREEMNISGAAG